MHAGNAEISMDQLVGGVEFGTFELEIGKTEMTAKAQEINIVIDQSGSMDEMCEDGNSKMNQIKHVTKNIMQFVCDNKNVSIGINSFNCQVNPVFDRTHITSENVNELTEKLKEVNAEDGTNIERPLRMLRDLPVTVATHVETYRNNIFMSDGDANEGATTPELLAHLVDVRATNYFIGFGLEHNPKLFSALSNRENSSYYFIDKIEKSGIAYGEILQSILYRALTDVVIKIENGLLYDWKTNTWHTEVAIGKMSGEMKRTFHILTSAKRDVKIAVSGKNVETGNTFKTVVGWIDANADLSRFIYRQKTQELLHRVKLLNEDSKEDRNTVREMKVEMKAFMADMVAFMKKNDLTEDRIMKNLCDDIVVIYRTIGTPFGHMYSCSRQVSNGMERAHNTSDTPKAPHKRGYKRGFMPRQCSVMTQEEDVFEFPEVNSDDDDMDVDDLMDKHEMSPLFYTSTQEDIINSLTHDDDV